MIPPTAELAQRSEGLVRGRRQQRALTSAALGVGGRVRVRRDGATLNGAVILSIDSGAKGKLLYTVQIPGIGVQTVDGAAVLPYARGPDSERPLIAREPVALPALEQWKQQRGRPAIVDIGSNSVPAVTAVRSQLGAMKLSELNTRAIVAGVAGKALGAALDDDHPREAVIALLVEHILATGVKLSEPEPEPEPEAWDGAASAPELAAFIGRLKETQSAARPLPPRRKARAVANAMSFISAASVSPSDDSVTAPGSARDVDAGAGSGEIAAAAGAAIRDSSRFRAAAITVASSQRVVRALPPRPLSQSSTDAGVSTAADTNTNANSRPLPPRQKARAAANAIKFAHGVGGLAATAPPSTSPAAVVPPIPQVVSAAAAAAAAPVVLMTRVVLHDLEPQQATDLRLRVGEIVYVTEATQAWWSGFTKDQGGAPSPVGEFPSNYVGEVPPSHSSASSDRPPQPQPEPQPEPEPEPESQQGAAGGGREGAVLSRARKLRGKAFAVGGFAGPRSPTLDGAAGGGGKGGDRRPVPKRKGGEDGGKEGRGRGSLARAAAKARALGSLSLEGLSGGGTTAAAAKSNRGAGRIDDNVQSKQGTRLSKQGGTTAAATGGTVEGEDVLSPRTRAVLAPASVSAARFKAYDRDGDGTMNVTEVKELMVAMGFAADDAYAAAALKRFDKNGDGSLDSAEFGPLFAFLKKQAAAAAADGGGGAAAAGGAAQGEGGGGPTGSSLARFDLDGSGGLDVKEVGVTLTKLGFQANEEYTRQVMEKFDANGDGQLDEAEFARLYAFCLANGGREGE